MLQIIVAESLKGRRTFARKGIVVFPMLVTLIAIVLIQGYYLQPFTYNLWVNTIMPACIALLGMSTIQQDKKSGYANVLTLPEAPKQAWLAKIFAVCIQVCVANGVLFLINIVTCMVFGAEFDVLRGALATIAIMVTSAWMVPLAMFLTEKFSSTVSFMLMFFLNFTFALQSFAGTKLWWIPFAIPTRMMAPILGVQPNGIPVVKDSALANRGVILPGVLIAVLVFAAVTLLTANWFEQRKGS